MRRAVARFLLRIMVGSFLSATGCTYLGNRGRDVRDIFDAGILVSDHGRPDFAAFLSFWNVLPMGHAHVDARLIGIGGGRVDVREFQPRDSWGGVARGANGIRWAIQVTTRRPCPP